MTFVKNSIHKSERIFYFDLIRALAILFVILAHTSKWYVNDSVTGVLATFSTTQAAIGNIGVPLFLMISGALLLNRDYELGEFLKKKIFKNLHAVPILDNYNNSI